MEKLLLTPPCCALWSTCRCPVCRELVSGVHAAAQRVGSAPNTPPLPIEADHALAPYTCAVLPITWLCLFPGEVRLHIRSRMLQKEGVSSRSHSEDSITLLEMSDEDTYCKRLACISKDFGSACLQLSSHQLCVHGVMTHPSPISLQSNCGFPRRLFTLLCTMQLTSVDIESAWSRA